jgi:hypothetical protein
MAEVATAISPLPQGEGWVRVSDIEVGTLGSASLPLTPTLSPPGRGR